MTESLQITIDPTPSINDLVQKQAEGFSVQRSAHVGNLAPYNLTIADAGIPILSVDHNVTGVDKSYVPEKIGRDASSVIAQSGRVACRAIAQDVPSGIALMTGGVRYLDQLHTTAARHILGTEQVFTNTEYLRTHESVAAEIAAIAAKTTPRLFDRLVLPDGSTRQDSQAARYISTHGIMQLNDDPRAEEVAVLVPNVVDIVANFVIEAINSGRPTLYHLSGPAMVNYMKDARIFQPVQCLYNEVVARSSFGTKLPARLEVRLVPSAHAQFATTDERAADLDRVIGAYEHAMGLSKSQSEQKRTFFASDTSKDLAARKEFVNQMNAAMTVGKTAILEASDAFPELFEDITPTIDQYAVHAEGGLYVAPINRTASMQELAAIRKYIDTVRKKRP